jgi:hypothetical protein
MDSLDQHSAIYAAMASARLEDLMPCRWSVEDREGCNTVWMLLAVCLEQTGERPVQIEDAIRLLMQGHVPRGATPYPDAAEALMARRNVPAEV